MINQQLLDYIKQNIARGISREDIKNGLRDAGWQENDIERGFWNIENPEKTQSPPIGVQTAALPGVFAILKDTWTLYRQRIGTFLGIMLMPILLMSSLTLLGISGGLLVEFLEAALSGIGMLIFFIIAVITVIIVGIVSQVWGYVSLIYAISSEEKIGVIESFRRGWHKILSYSWISVLTALIVAGGLILGIIPGIIFSVWLSLALFILISEDVKGLNALLRSKEYIKGYWWSVVWRSSITILIIAGFYLIIFISSVFANLFGGISFIDTIGNYIVNILTIPFVTVYGFLIYKNLRIIKGTLAFESQKRGLFIALAIWGVAALIGLMIALPLLSVVIGTSQASRGRDARRVSDIRSIIQLGNEIYHDKNGFYASQVLDLKTEGAMFEVPIDPQSGLPYDYCVTSDKQGYGIGVQLEQKSPYMYSSVSESQILCSPNSSKICGRNEYYCASNVGE